MVYDKLTPLEYLEFVARLWSVDAATAEARAQSLVGWSLFVWGYSLAWFLFNDGVKLLAYRLIEPADPPSPAPRQGRR